MSEEVTNEEVSTEEVVEETTDTVEETTGDIAFVESMLNQISDDDIKSAPFWENLQGKDATEVGRYMKEMQSYVGKKGDIPKADASEEEWNEFHKKLGWSESLDDYNFGMNDEFIEIIGEDSVEHFTGVIDTLKQSLQQQGLNPDKAEGVVDSFLEFTAKELQERNAAMEEMNKESDRELRKEWGDGYDSILNGIKVMLRANGMSEDSIEAMEESGVLTEPDLAVTLGKISSKFEDDPEIGHVHTNTMAGLRDQLFEAQTEVEAHIKAGTKIPTHLYEKWQGLREKFGEDL